jgi:hypothetical protein
MQPQAPATLHRTFIDKSQYAHDSAAKARV